MMDQMDFFSVVPTEEWVFDVLFESLLSVIKHNNVSADKLIRKEGKSYSSVWYDTQLAFRICCREGHHYFGISNAYLLSISDDFSYAVTTEGRSEGFTNYSFSPTFNGIMDFSPFLSSVLDMAIDFLPKEFDCCSRYEECSNVKQCTNPNATLATGCGYRKIMKKGLIFYGHNRNID